MTDPAAELAGDSAPKSTPKKRRLRADRRITYALVLGLVLSNFFFRGPGVGLPDAEDQLILAGDNSTDVGDAGGAKGKKTVGIIDDNGSHLFLTYAQSRSDRMGSRIQQPFLYWAIAKSAGWNYCAQSESMTVAVGFETCEKEVLAAKPHIDFHMPEDKFWTRRKYIGTIAGGGYHWNSVLRLTERKERGRPGSLLTPALRKEWRDKILNTRSKYETKLAREDLFRPRPDGGAPSNATAPAAAAASNGTKYVAIHVRRGDVTMSGKVRYAFYHDEVFHDCIVQIKSYIEKRGFVASIHIFSENYGDVRWKTYPPYVDGYHLAGPRPKDPIGQNLRDWRHFVRADVLVVGGTFSRIPSYARGPKGKDGFPLTIFLTGGMPFPGMTYINPYNCWQAVIKNRTCGWEQRKG